MRLVLVSGGRVGQWYRVPLPVRTRSHDSQLQLPQKGRPFCSTSPSKSNGTPTVPHLSPVPRNGVGIIDTTDLTLPSDGSPLRCTKDQWLYRPTADELELFRKSSLFPPKPIDAEGSVIIRLVDVKGGVTSPVGRAVFYSEYGMRAGECTRIIFLGSFCCIVFCALGYWQLRRRDWKRNLLGSRRDALSLPLVRIASFQTIDDALTGRSGGDSPVEYRCVECTGVLDTSCKLLVGPRPSLYHSYGESAGYNVVYPLRFDDGSAVLVNMGWLGNDDVMNDMSCPELVTLRGVVVEGDITESLLGGLKLRMIESYQDVMSRLFGVSFPPAAARVNRPRRLVRDDSRKVYRYLDPASMSHEVYSKSPSITGRYALNVYDVLYHDDVPKFPASEGAPKGSTPCDDQRSRFVPKSSIGRAICSTRPAYQRRQKSDYLLFYADPDTHLNYAAQWFLMAASIAGMCIYKVFRVRQKLNALLWP